MPTLRRSVPPALTCAVLLICACSSKGPASTSTTGGITRPDGGGTTGGGGDGLGSTCSATNPCSESLTCFSEGSTQIPGGYCSEACGPAACPAASSCIEVIPSQALCVLDCRSDADCTRAGYLCDPVCQVCVPCDAVGLVTCGGDAGPTVGSGGRLPDGGTCSGLPPAADSQLTWTTSVDVSASAATQSEAEGSLAASSDGKILAAYQVVGTGGATNWIGVAYSSNDASSFTAGQPLVSAADGYTLDPSVAVDSNGLFYLAFGGYGLAGGGTGEVWVTTTADGVHFPAPVNALTAADIPAGGGGVDKPTLGINPLSQRAEIACTVFGGQFGPGAHSEIRWTAGTPDAGFLPTVGVDDETRANFRDLPSLAFDQAGHTFAAWIEVNTLNGGASCAAPGQNAVIEDQVLGKALVGTTAASVYFAASSDGGGFSDPNTLVSATADAVVVNRPAVAASADGSSLYVVYGVASVGRSADATDVEVAVSSDHGATFATRNMVNDDLGCATHFHPSAVVDGTGRLWVSWVDNRDGAGHVFYSVSTNQGRTFSAGALVSDQPFEFTTLYGVPAWLGGYQALAASPTELYSLWSGAAAGNGDNAPAHVFAQKTFIP